MELAIKEAAQRLAEANASSVNSLMKIYLFPHEQEIRLLEIDSATIESDEVTPFSFSSDNENGIPFPSSIAVILPHEFGKLPLPKEWGEWSSAELIWERGKIR